MLMHPLHIQVEKRVEKIRQVCLTTSKKLNACMQSTGPDVEKRLVILEQQYCHLVVQPVMHRNVPYLRIFSL